MWQFITTDAETKSPTPAMLRKTLGINVSQLHSVGEIRHTLTHRKYVFKIFTGVVAGKSAKSPNRKWATLAELDRYPLSRPQSRMIEIIVGHQARQKVGKPVVKNSHAAPKISCVR
jgi:adenine-specific DNA glycosylase